MLDCFEGERCCSKTNPFVHVLEHQCVLTFVVTTAGTAITDVMTDHCLKLERDMLDNVRRIRAVARRMMKPPRSPMLHRCSRSPGIASNERRR